MNLNKAIIIGNWKSNFTTKDLKKWALEWKNFKYPKETRIVICPPYHLITNAALMQNIKIGTQDISAFPKGSFTGEVAVELLPPYVKYCLLGHSERRKYQKENMDLIIQKIDRCIKYSVTPVFCFENLEDIKMLKNKVNKCVLAFEPSKNISNGNNFAKFNPQDIKTKIIEIRKIVGDTTPVLYGGSVNKANAINLRNTNCLNGFLVGKSSLNVNDFKKIIKSWNHD